jgi:hypothetical protein
MIKEINTNFKGIRVSLKDLGDINYFVGKNGSGKTRLFEAINEFVSCCRKKSISKFTTIEFDRVCCIAHNKCELNDFMVQDKMDYEIIDKNNPYNKRRLGLGCSNDFIKNPTTQKILEAFGMEGLYFEMGYMANNGINQDNCIKFYKDESKADFLYWLDECSSGFQSLFKTWNNIYHQTLSGINGKVISYSFSFDEGDRHLHPSLAKEFPKNLEIIKNGICDQLRIKGASEISVQFFISTHSPFLISALRDGGLNMVHKVYILDKGQTIEPRGRINTPESWSGYSSEHVLLAINHMLGVNLADLSPDVFILAEESIHVLLDTFAKKIGVECKYFRYVTRGDADTIEKALALCAQKKVIPFFNSKIWPIFDGKLNDGKKKVELEKILGGDFLYVKNNEVLELESCYPIGLVDNFINSSGWSKWDHEQYKKFKDYLNFCVNKDPQKQGEIKSELARYIVNELDVESLKYCLPILGKVFD